MIDLVKQILSKGKEGPDTSIYIKHSFLTLSLAGYRNNNFFNDPLDKLKEMYNKGHEEYSIKSRNPILNRYLTGSQSNKISLLNYRNL